VDGCEEGDMKTPLWLHRELSPDLWRLGDEILDVYEIGEPAQEAHFIAAAAANLDHATIFDCRKLPDGLVLDTGQATMIEPADVRGPIRLPFDVTYFEFADDYAVLAHTGAWWGEHGRLGHVEDGFEDSVILIGFHKPENFEPDGKPGIQMSVALIDNLKPLIDNLKPPDKGFLGTMVGEQRFGVYAATMMVGALGLMKERLVVSNFVPDPEPRLTLARKKRGKPPLTSDSHVVTLNVPAVRRAVAGATKAQGHESPALHWRRGHWRVLHRGSEFEKNAWVRKCLVGDPDKGFVSNTYRLRHELPMIVNDNPPPVQPPLGAA
jgi:hypothetical protein